MLMQRCKARAVKNGLKERGRAFEGGMKWTNTNHIRSRKKHSIYSTSMLSITASKIKTIVKTVLIGSRFKAIAKMSKEFPKTLAEFGYGFNEDGILRKINKETGQPGDEGFEFNVTSDPIKNQQHYEALGEAITEYVYELLEKNGMHKIYIPDDVPNDEATFIFCSKKTLENPKKLLVLIHGSGVVRAGQWSRSLIINHSLDHGTQIPYIKKAKELGYEVVITNTNDNYRLINGKKVAITGHGSPTSHATSVWKKFVIGTNTESVGIVAHSYGGVVTIDLAKKFAEFFKEKVFAIGFTDSVHSMSGVSDDIRELLLSSARNWITSTKPLNTELSSSHNDIPWYSAGHTKHEWTSYSSISSLFEFFEKQYKEFREKKLSKRLKLDP